MDYQIKLFSQLNEELKKIWTEVEIDSHPTCFNSYTWIENYIYSFENSNKNFRLRVFVVFYQRNPVCIFPFQIENKFRTNILKWACDLRSDFNVPLQKQDFSFEEQSFNKLWKKILNMMPEIDVIHLKKQINFYEKSNNPFVNFLKNSNEGAIHQISLPAKWNEYVDKFLKKKFYSDLMRTKRLMKKHGRVKFVIAKNSKEKEKFVDILIKQKMEKLAKNNLSTLGEQDLNFYKNFEKYKDKKYTTQVSAIQLDGEYIALHWGIFDKNYYYYLLPSMKEEHVKKFAPGKLLLSLLIRWSISKKIKFFDFGLGEEFYKSKWSNKTVNIYEHIGLNKLSGIFFYLILKIKQSNKYLKIIKNK